MKIAGSLLITCWLATAGCTQLPADTSPCGPMIGYEDEFVKVLPDGHVRLKKDTPLLIGEHRGVSYMRPQGSGITLSCSCSGSGSCTSSKDDIGLFCSNSCSVGCTGTIIRDLTIDVNFRAYVEASD